MQFVHSHKNFHLIQSSTSFQNELAPVALDPSLQLASFTAIATDDVTENSVYTQQHYLWTWGLAIIVRIV